MSWVGYFVLMAVLLFALMIPGTWIAICLGISGLAALFVSDGFKYFSTLGTITWNAAIDFTLSAVPVFMLMGEVIVASGLSKNFFRGLMKWGRRIPGSLLHVSVVACAIFSAISGSGPATASGIGSIAIPEMKKRRYPAPQIYGTLASSGTLGILIPPSLVLILYGSLTDLSIVKLFSAAIVPGLILTGFFLVYTFGSSVLLQKRHPEKTPILMAEDEDMTTGQALKGILPLIITIVVLLGSLYGGFATPIESAALGTFIVLVFGFWLGDLTAAKVYESAKNASKSTVMCIILMITAKYFTFAVSRLNINRYLTQWVIDANFSPVAFLAVIGVIYLILGCFMDGGSIIVLTIPLLAPIATELGIDLVWLAVYITVLVQIGQVTPPMGLNLFIVQGVDRDCKFGDVCRGVVPYIAAMCIFCVFLIAFPQMCAWVPALLGY